MSEPLTQKEFGDLLARTNTNNPNPEDLRLLRSVLEQRPDVIEQAGNMAVMSRVALFNLIKTPPGNLEVLQMGNEFLSRELGYPKASPLEKLLIDQVVLCYTRLYLWECQYHTNAGNQNLSLEQAKQWESLISSAQKRYFRAIETLERIRRLNIQIQVNIAADGSQQVNVANLSSK